jgi:hypothetical protein
MAENLNSSILFTEEELNRLHRRIFELVDERLELVKLNAKSEKDKKRLMRVIENLKKEKAEADKAYEEEHMLRFGDVMNLEVLDSLVPTKEVLAAREAFKKEEKEAEKRVEEAKAKFLAVKKKLLEEKKENTRILKKITSLGETQMRLNKNLDSTNQNLLVRKSYSLTDFIERR